MQFQVYSLLFSGISVEGEEFYLGANNKGVYLLWGK